MHTAFIRAAALTAFVALPLAASAASKPFPALAGWDHTTPQLATPAPGRGYDTYKKDDQQVTVLSDTGLVYADIVGAVKKNVSDNGIKTSIDRDFTCGTKHAHEIEMILGSTVYRQLIVDDNPGVTKVTYMRTQGSTPAADALGALTSYCGT